MRVVVEGEEIRIQMRSARDKWERKRVERYFSFNWRRSGLPTRTCPQWHADEWRAEVAQAVWRRTRPGLWTLGISPRANRCWPISSSRWVQIIQLNLLPAPTQTRLRPFLHLSPTHPFTRGSELESQTWPTDLPNYKLWLSSPRSVFTANSNPVSFVKKEHKTRISAGWNEP